MRTHLNALRKSVNDKAQIKTQNAVSIRTTDKIYDADLCHVYN